MTTTGQYEPNWKNSNIAERFGKGSLLGRGLESGGGVEKKHIASE